MLLFSLLKKLRVSGFNETQRIIIEGIIKSGNNYNTLIGSEVVFDGSAGDSKFFWIPDSNASVRQYFEFNNFPEMATGELIIQNSKEALNIAVPDQVKSNNSVDTVDPESPELSINALGNNGGNVQLSFTANHNLSVGDKVSVDLVGTGVAAEVSIQEVVSIEAEEQLTIDLGFADIGGGDYTSGGTLQKANAILYLSPTYDITWYSFIIFNGDVYLTDRLV